MDYVIIKRKIRDITQKEMDIICKTHYKTCGKCPLKRKGGIFCFKIKKDAGKDLTLDPLAEREIYFYKKAEDL